MHKNKELERKSAVSRYFNGESPKNICVSISRPRKWLYKWIARFKSGDADWFLDDSRSPKHCPSKTASDISAKIVAARISLENTPYADRGVFAIRQKLSDQGVDGIPSEATINRIISAAGLVKKDSPRTKVGTPYPVPIAEMPNDVHQLDLWGPRYLGVGKLCYLLNIVDIARRMPSIHAIPNKSFQSMIPAIVRCWQTVGIPKVLQMDNGIVTGTSLHPGSINKMLRLCLHIGIEVLFVPFAEPWRQGIVEKFNDFVDKNFFITHRFQDLTDLCEQVQTFQDYCWYNRRPSALKGKTPCRMFPDVCVHLLPEDFVIPEISSIPAGKIRFIRMVRSNLLIDVLGHKFPVDENYYKEYVTATLSTGSGVLRIYHQAEQIAEFKFSMC